MKFWLIAIVKALCVAAPVCLIAWLVPVEYAARGFALLFLLGLLTVLFHE